MIENRATGVRQELRVLVVSERLRLVQIEAWSRSTGRTERINRRRHFGAVVPLQTRQWATFGFPNRKRVFAFAQISGWVVYLRRCLVVESWGHGFSVGVVNFSRADGQAGVELGRVYALGTISTNGIIGTI